MFGTCKIDTNTYLRFQESNKNVMYKITQTYLRFQESK